MRSRLWWVIGICWSILWAGYAWAEGFNVTPSVAVRQEYNDNIFFTTTGAIDDYITTISPGLEISQESERLNASLNGRVDGLVYYDNEELNDLDQEFTGQVQYQFTPRTQGSFDASYLRDSRADRDIGITGLVLGTDIRRRRHVGASASHAVSEKAVVQASYGYEREEFDDLAQNDYDVNRLGLAMSYNLARFWQEAMGRIRFDYVNVDYVTSKVDNYSLTVGFEKRLTETYRLSVDIGPRYTRTEFDLAGIPDNTAWGVRGVVSLRYHGEYLTTSLNFLHDVQPASGRIGSTERTGLTGSVGHRITEKLRWDIHVAYFLNQSDRRQYALTDIDENTFRIRPRLRYQFTPDMALEADYAYTLINDEIADTEREQNLFFLRFEWQYPLMGS